MIRLLAVLLLLAPGFASAEEPKTDLGERGNALVAERFAAYVAANPEGACQARGSGRRVLVSGFGLFQGVPYNVSAAVIRSLAQGETNRTLEIEGETFDVCFLVLDVIWDLAGAVLIREASLFKPEAVVMTGRGSSSASFEAGAINSGTGLSGYGPDGTPLGGDNRPVSSWLLEDYPPGHALALSWDPRALADANEAEIRALGYSATAQRAARSDNDYLCNNVSFLMAHAAKNRATRLAGGKVVLGPAGFSKEPIVGFLHFPAVDAAHTDLAGYREGIAGWAKVVARTIKLSVRRP